MKKLILGITAVFCLQIGFIVYNAVNPFPDASSIVISTRANEPAPDSVELATLSTESEFAGDDSAVAPDLSQARRPERSEIVSAVRANFRLPRSTRRMRPMSQTASLTGRGKVIFKNEYASVIVTPLNYVQPTTGSDMPQSEKRSLFVNVIKKPYDLVKAIGSKFK